MAPLAVSVRDLHYAYPDGTPALSGVEMSIAAGERWALIGPNGAGKTTLFLLLDGLLKPASGEIIVLGAPLVNERDMTAIRKRVGFLFQSPDDQLFCPTVFEEVVFGPLNHDLLPNDAHDRAHEALHRTGLDGYESRVPHHLSGGEKRRVALASVLAMEPDLLLFDEPTNGLDPKARADMMGLLQRTPGTHLIATHDYELVLTVCDHVALMDRGTMIRTGTPAEILADRALLESHGLVQPPWLPYLLDNHHPIISGTTS